VGGRLSERQASSCTWYARTEMTEVFLQICILRPDSWDLVDMWPIVGLNREMTDATDVFSRKIDRFRRE
jgi:hypothetical protein